MIENDFTINQKLLLYLWSIFLKFENYEHLLLNS